MELRFTVFSNGAVSADLQLYRDARWENGWYISGASEKLVFGYNIFDTEFYNTVLKNVISQIDMEDFLPFLNTQYKIPQPIILYPGINHKCSGERFNDMGLRFRNDLSFSEKLSYYQEHKLDTQQTYLYNCKTDRDIALSELHYYISHGYKLIYCKMCGKPFFSNNRKSKYCRRIGENSNYPNRSCNKVRELERNHKSTMRNETARKRKIIISTLDKREQQHNFKYSGIKNCFMSDSDNYRSTHTYNEYAVWINEQYKLYVPKGRLK